MEEWIFERESVLEENKWQSSFRKAKASEAKTL